MPNSTKPPDLNDLRKQIDAIDLQIQKLINHRARCAQQVADVKLAVVRDASKTKSSGLDNCELDNSESNISGSKNKDLLESVQFYRPDREANVLRNIMRRNEGPLPAEEMAHIFRSIMSACLALEQPMHVAYLGPKGTFTQAAVAKHFGHAVISQAATTIDAVFAQVDSRECHYGVVPVENSSEGMVDHTLDNFMVSSLKICGEVELPIKMNLLVNKNTSAEKITKICAHQQALGQCRNWLSKYWPGIETIAVSSNAEAALMASEADEIAAIAGDMAVDIYGLVTLSEGIHDHANNTTRFLVVGHEEVAVSGDDKTSLIVSTHDKPGALFKLLEPFHKADIMLTRIDTRPSRTDKWSYVFFIEFEGHRDDDKIKSILDNLEEHSLLVKWLGSYPRAVL